MLCNLLVARWKHLAVFPRQAEMNGKAEGSTHILIAAKEAVGGRRLRADADTQAKA